MIFPRGLVHLLEMEWNLTTSLPPYPVLEYGINVLLAEVVELLENDILGKILWMNVFILGPLDISPGDSSP